MPSDADMLRSLAGDARPVLPESPQGAPVRPPLAETRKGRVTWKHGKSLYQSAEEALIEVSEFALHLEAERERDAKRIAALEAASREEQERAVPSPESCPICGACECYDWPHGLSDEDQERVTTLFAHLVSLSAPASPETQGVTHPAVAMLARLQWCYSDDEMIRANIDVGVCPICFNYDTDGHAETCTLAAALRSPAATGTAQPVGEWRPFATAPKDGFAILAYHEEEGVLIARWCEDEESFDGVWRWFAETGEDLTEFPPSHWMPLPAPPSPGARTPEGSA